MHHIWFLVSLVQEEAINEEEIALIGYVIFVVLLLSVIVILFFVTFQKRKNKLLLDQIQQQKAFDDEIARTQTEIQEETLKHIGWELHDNVGQLLVFANMQMGMISKKISEDLKPKLDEATQIVKDSLMEVRSLSKSLNNDVLLNMGFEDSITNELNRLKRMKFESVDLLVKGEKRELNDQKHEIILFRILQEFFSNSVKYSEAKHLNVILDYQSEHLKISAKDDGIGFDLLTAEKGSGLINMKSRAELIGASFNLTSQPNQGAELTIDYTFK